MNPDYLPISDYGVIGDMETVALVGRNGSIDWYCQPVLDSPSTFAAILDANRGGSWSISPAQEFTSDQRYLGHTNILVTEFTTTTGRLEVVDFMPISQADKSPEIIRRVRCTAGRVDVEVAIDPIFDYGRVPARVETMDDSIVFHGPTSDLKFLKPTEIIFDKGRAVFLLQQGGSADFSLSDVLRTDHFTPDADLQETRRYWEDWAHRCESTKCPLHGPWHDLAIRSGLVLKLLTHRHNGSIAAAPTTSLPESLEGNRNWDYRFAWLRDSVFTVQALLSLGYVKEALSFLEWIVELCASAPPEDLAVLYKLHPEVQIIEETLSHLSGYRGVGPVRIGNAASEQKQLDIFGELLRGARLFTEHGGELNARDWAVIGDIVDHVARVWMEPDAGIWEMRGPNRHYVYSKVMCWAAVNEGVNLAESFDPDDERLPHWRATREEIFRTVLEKGLDPDKNAFVQYFGAEHADAANLLIPMTGFLPFTDERIVNTIQFVMDELSTEGLVRRYIGPDSLEGHEGAFLACSFWLVDCLVGVGQLDDAVSFLTKIVSKANHLGLFSEEYDPINEEHLGNFPQAFTHLALVNSVVSLTNALVEEGGEEALKSIV